MHLWKEMKNVKSLNVTCNM